MQLFPILLRGSVRSALLACVIGIGAWLVSTNVWAFPELQRHGYVNCTSCHVSPNGGGVLTAYGRALSKEALSTWGSEEETKFAYFVDSVPEWLHLGGDLRALYLYRDTPRVQEGKWIIMQADLEAYASIDSRWYAGGSIGVKEQPGVAGKEYKFTSRRHFLMWKPTDELSVRAGRFHTAYGLNIQDHATVVKRSIGFDQGQENYNLEFSYLGESWNHFVSVFTGQPDLPVIQRENGFALRSAYAITEKIKMGLSYYFGAKDLERRHLIGPYAILAFTDHLFLLSEVELQFTKPRLASRSSATGIASYHKLGYEVFQGFIPFLTQENLQLDFRRPLNHAYAHGVGVQWLPRPHWEFQLAYQKQKTSQFQRRYIDAAWFQAHFYF